MKLLLRILLLLAMLYLAYRAALAYAFDFVHGYPLAPLIGLAVCFGVYVQLRPKYSKPKPVVYNGQSLDSLLFLVLAIISAAYMLNLRNETAFQPLWFLHLATLTFFQLLVPYIAAYGFARLQTFVTMLVALLLIGLLWKGTEMSRLGKTRFHYLESGIGEFPTSAAPDSFRPDPRAAPPATAALPGRIAGSG